MVVFSTNTWSTDNYVIYYMIPNRSWYMYLLLYICICTIYVYINIQTIGTWWKHISIIHWVDLKHQNQEVMAPTSLQPQLPFMVLFFCHYMCIYIYISLSPLIFHLDIPFGNWPIAPKYISHNPITHSYWTLPFNGTRYVVSSSTSTMVSRGCSI